MTVVSSTYFKFLFVRSLNKLGDEKICSLCPWASNFSLSDSQLLVFLSNLRSHMPCHPISTGV
jgi:hypothetical protein